MTGEVDQYGTPIVRIPIGGQARLAVIDTGFDGFVVVPDSLVDEFPGEFWGEAEVTLGGGQTTNEDLFTIQFPFDGVMRSVQASFCPTDEFLIGTGMLEDYRLEVNWVAGTVLIEKVRA